MKPNMESLLFVIGFVFILILINHNANADVFSGQTNIFTDTDLIIVDSESPPLITYDESGDIKIDVVPSANQPTFIYGANELTIIQQTPLGIISY